MSADDARFYALKDHDDANALRAWQTVEPLVSAMTETPRSLPKVHLDYAVTEIIRVAPTFAQHRAPILARLNAAQAAETAQAIDALPRLAFAVLYVLRMDEAETHEGPTLATLNAEGVSLRKRGLTWCAALEGFGTLPAGTTAAIKKGLASYYETAADLQRLYNTLSPHRALILQLGGPIAQPLTEADLDRMLRLSALIRAMIPEGKAPLSWRIALLRLAHHLADTYHVAHAWMTLHLTLTKDPTSVPSFHSLRRPPRSSQAPAHRDQAPTEAAPQG
jgi:hypothetical protein